MTTSSANGGTGHAHQGGRSGVRGGLLIVRHRPGATHVSEVGRRGQGAIPSSRSPSGPPRLDRRHPAAPPERSGAALLAAGFSFIDHSRLSPLADAVSDFVNASWRTARCRRSWFSVRGFMAAAVRTCQARPQTHSQKSNRAHGRRHRQYPDSITRPCPLPPVAAGSEESFEQPTGDLGVPADSGEEVGGSLGAPPSPSEGGPHRFLTRGVGWYGRLRLSAWSRMGGTRRFGSCTA